MDEKQRKVALDNETRWRRIVQNDLESIPLAFLVFWSAIQNGVNPEVTKTLMMVFTTARFGHTIAYASRAAKSRMACWMSGTTCILMAAGNIAMNVIIDFASSITHPRNFTMTITDINMFAMSATVLYIKFLACTIIQGRKAFAAGTRMPEDNQLPQARDAPNQDGFADLTDDQVRTAIDEEMRWKRIVQNDLESMPMAYVVFWSAICVGVTGGITKTLIFVYTVARVGHTIVYIQGMAHARMACWIVGMGCVVIVGVAGFLAALF
ncbi:hypothetical protein PHMEG_00028860 [Phytophthora megakarya]|uniref:Microsomal glutathione S-transferase 1 n=1 Tax=Phytophthora megakarya TaxID=4795 RepID=A0A225V2A4_9STRA|nr:hypothetical protein PHMEG_00028860 [Phytophthora megakarya]